MRNPTTVLLASCALAALVFARANAGDGDAPPPAKPEPKPAAPADPADPRAEHPNFPERYGDAPEELLPYRSTCPNQRYFREKMRFTGPGRDEPEPTGLKTIRLGLLAPVSGSPEVFIGHAMQEGTTLAVEEANKAGGHKGVPFEIVTRNERAVWGEASNEIVAFAYEDGCWAMIGGCDGVNAHVALRVALKIEMPMVSTSDPDPTLTETNIPWLIRVNPDDRQECYRLATHVFEERKIERVAVLRANYRYARAGIGEFVDSARRLGHPVVADLRWAYGATQLEGPFAKIRQTQAQAVVMWGHPAEMGAVVKAMREAGIDIPVFCSSRMVDASFLAAAGPAAEGCTAPFPYDPNRDDPAWKSFRERFGKRFGHEPSQYAAYAYDGTRILLDAIAAKGLNRPLIRDHMVDRDWYDGVTGRMRFDPTANNISRCILARVKDGRFVYADR